MEILTGPIQMSAIDGLIIHQVLHAICLRGSRAMDDGPPLDLDAALSEDEMLEAWPQFVERWPWLSVHAADGFELIALAYQYIGHARVEAERSAHMRGYLFTAR